MVIALDGFFPFFFAYEFAVFHEPPNIAVVKIIRVAGEVEFRFPKKSPFRQRDFQSMGSFHGSFLRVLVRCFVFDVGAVALCAPRISRCTGIRIHYRSQFVLG